MGLESKEELSNNQSCLQGTRLGCEVVLLHYKSEVCKRRLSDSLAGPFRKGELDGSERCFLIG